MIGLRLQPKPSASTKTSQVPTSKPTNTQQEAPIMSSPAVVDKAATNGSSNGVANGKANGAANGQSKSNVPQQTVASPTSSPLASPKPIVVAKRATPPVSGSTEAIENQSTESSQNVRRTESHVLSSRTQSRSTTNMTDTSSTSTVKFTSDRQVVVLHETVTSTRTRFIQGIEHVNARYIDSMSIEGFLEYIESERLTHMPHRGSKYDKVLKWAEFYAVQIAGYQQVVSSFVQDSRGAAQLIWVACRLLLELGPENAQALEITFGVFYKLGLSLSFFLRNAKLLSSSSHIRQEVGLAFNEMLLLVNDVAMHYRVATRASYELNFDFNIKFGRHMDAFYKRTNHITDAMWTSQLQDENESVDIRTVRKWLSVRDNTIQNILNDRRSVRGQRDEYTCDWFQRYLLDFSRGKDELFSVTGPSGCGKSVLAGWIVERLQRPLGRKTHTTLSYIVESDIPSESSSVAIVKDLLLQLLQTNVGDVRLFRALAHAHEVSLTSRDSKTIEEALWNALDTGLNSVDGHLVIVVDGLDEVRGGAPIFNAVSQRLGALAHKHSGVQSIILSGSAPQLSNIKTATLQITADHVHRDIHHVAKHALRGNKHFDEQVEAKREAIVEQVTHAAKGSFLWLLLTAQILHRETSSEKYLKTLESLSKLSLSELINELVKVADLAKLETKLLLSWLLVAERPLHIEELKNLLEVDIQKAKLVARTSDIEQTLQSCGPLIRTRNGVVSFQHASIRTHLIEIQVKGGKELLDTKAAQADLTLRTLAYCKFILTKTYEPVFVPIDMADVNDLFRQYSLLEYTVTNWVLHFQNSSLYKNGALELSSEFKAIYPASVHLALIEWACWQAQTSTHQAIDMHELALKVREAVFTEKHNTVLQTIITSGTLHQKLGHTNEAAKFFYRGSKIGQSILTKYSPITLNLTTTFLTITETIKTTTRTEVVTWKEEMFKYVIESYTAKLGKSSDIVIRYYNMLAELYVEIHEETHAEETWRGLRDIVVSRHGKGSEEDIRISGQLNIVLKKSDVNGGEVQEYDEELFKTTEKMEIWDVRRIEITIKLAETYEAHSEFVKAEELYVMLWQRMMEHSHNVEHHQLGMDIHISTIDIALKYVYFLRRVHRDEEACGILICLWNEYENYEFQSEKIIQRLKVVAEVMVAVKLLTIAVSVFRKCWTWFKANGKHEQYSSVETQISETIQEITTSTTQSTRSTTVTTTTTSTESVIKDVFESTVSKTTVTSETIRVCKSLVSYYTKLEQWSEVVTTAERSLALIWKVIVTGGGTIALPREFGSEAIELALLLAVAHRRSHHYHEAEAIYLRIYRACWASCVITDVRLTNACTVLIKFYEEHLHWQKVIGIYQEMLVEYRRHYGPSHKETIKLLYLLGSLCSIHGHGDSTKYYEEIVTVLNGKNTVCHLDAQEAMIILCRVYYESGNWEKLKVTCQILWTTWTKHQKEHKFEASFIELLYMRYIYVLEHHSHADYEEIRSLTVTYRDTCLVVYTATAAITIKSLMELAHVSMRSEKYMHEAIKYYEEIIKTTTTTSKSTTTTVSTTEITTIKAKLTKAYIHVCSKETASTETIQQAVKVVNDRFEQLKLTLGFSHSETLSVLRELLVLYVKVKNVKVVHQLLQSTTIEIITREKQSKSLYESAKVIAGIYLTCGVVDFGQAIIRELRRQIITKVYTGSEQFGFKIDAKVGKSCYVFLVAFEQHLNGKTALSYSEIMAELLTETFLYESYMRSLKTGTSIEVTMTSSARYWAYLTKHSRTDEVKLVENSSFDIFTKKWGHVIKTSRDITFIFYRGLFSDLSTRTVSISNAACAVASHVVRGLLDKQQYQEAYGVATCAFQLIKEERGYHNMLNIGHGFKLSAYMAGRGLENKNLAQVIEPALYAEMLKLSQAIIRDVLDACKESKINFVRLKLGELNDLVGLLGAQGNFGDLEWLLESLWSSREVQKNWTSTTIISIGKRYVQAKLLGNHGQAAIRLCEDIRYNLRRVWGDLDPKVLEMSEVLSQVYTNAKHYHDAMGVHEEILRLVVEGDDDDDSTIDTMDPWRAKLHLDLLKRSYQRLGKWDKSPAVYKELVDRLLSMPVYKNDVNFRGVQSTDKWNVKEELSAAAKALGTFTPPEEWEFVKKNMLTENGDLIVNGRANSGNGTLPLTAGDRPGLGMKRASSNWGLQLIHKYIIGDETDVD